MDAETLIETIKSTLSGVHVLEASQNHFFYYHPDPDQTLDDRMPFATLMTNDDNDQASQLCRPGIYRLNIGLKPETYQRRFGKQPPMPEGNGIIQTGHDFTALDQIMPHPVYAAMSWVCVLNPGPETSEQVMVLLQEAHQTAVRRHEARTRKGG
ncbi:DUF6194 family protein [Deinococcus cellulosilyticus]|uniref:DUF6194 domain-containing protein n=1 Tax=Deinococcus cellulosilyticus (strain DSM 18568 / NBRC 106333 / KACC 11606 / 5516J-15) TaxID=1223518 RepID=A0A511N0V6_DEIC1|nr:DUF6194 family protein [Deinococcus cellulosilyticus]GEM46503.1 hypothetical protein DC3_21380 [Deinococcus cellulosilyticus NBRC 106333 = KACC 11606]